MVWWRGEIDGGAPDEGRCKAPSQSDKEEAKSGAEKRGRGRGRGGGGVHQV